MPAKVPFIYLIYYIYNRFSAFYGVIIRFLCTAVSVYVTNKNIAIINEPFISVRNIKS